MNTVIRVRRRAAPGLAGEGDWGIRTPKLCDWLSEAEGQHRCAVPILRGPDGGRGLYAGRDRDVRDSEEYRSAAATSPSEVGGASRRYSKTRSAAATQLSEAVAQARRCKGGC